MSSSTAPTADRPRREWILELVLFFSLPAIALCVGLSLESRFGSSLRSSRQRHAQLVLADQQRGYGPHLHNEECDRIESLRMDVWLAERTSAGALWAIAIGVSLIAGTEAAGWCARRFRWMLAVFTPCLYAFALALTALFLLHAALACLLIYYLNDLWVYFLAEPIGGDESPLYVVLLLIVGGGALLLSVLLFFDTIAAGRPPMLKVLGRSVTEQEAPELWSAVRDLARESGSKPPTAIVVGLDPSFFVTESRVEHLAGVARGRVLCFSLPLYRAMSARELRGVLLSELARFGTRRTITSRRVCRIANDPPVRIEGPSLDGLEQPHGASVRCLEGFMDTALATIRARAKAADEAAARDVGPVTLASALLKKHLYRGLDVEVWYRVVRVLTSGQVVGNVSDFRAQLAFKKLAGVWVRRYKMMPPGSGDVPVARRPDRVSRLGVSIADNTLPAGRGAIPVDPLPERLSRLGVSMDDLDLKAVFGPPSEDASALVGDLERLEVEMSMEYQREVAWQLAMSWPPNPPAPLPAEPAWAR